MDNFIGMDFYTLVLSFTLPQVNNTKEPNPKNLPETAMSQQAEALMKKSFRIMQGILY